jgi:hypothetical protein
MLRRAWRSAALRAAATLGISGVALACGNLMLARALPPVEFARFVLLYSVIQIGMNVAPLGADVVLARMQRDPVPGLNRQVLWTSAIAAGALAVACAIFYSLSPAMLTMLWIAVTAGGIRTIEIARLRSAQRFDIALALTMSTNAAVLIASAATLLLSAGSALLPAAAMAATICAIAIASWRSTAATAMRSGNAAAATVVFPWREGWSAVSFIAAGMLLASLERLVTPGLLGLSAMATFSVLATVAGSPFTMLYQGIGYTLLPNLRNARDQSQRRRVLLHEASVVALTCSVSGIAAWWLTPVVTQHVLAGRYHIPPTLLLVTILAGMLKVASSLPTAIVSALGSGADLARLSVVGWLAVFVSAAAAAIGARWGLTGVVAGVACGWLLRAAVATWIAVPYLAKRPARSA